MSGSESYLDDLLAHLNDVIVEKGPDGAATRRAVQQVAATSRRFLQESPAVDAPSEVTAETINSDPLPGEFWPLEPANWEAMKMTPEAAEELVLKCLMGRGTLSGREIADHIAVPFGILCEVLEQLKTDRLVTHRGAAQLGDFLYQLTENGVEAAGRYRANAPTTVRRPSRCPSTSPA